jgi:GNAT superfamily N-acetyltransferase
MLRFPTDLISVIPSRARYAEAQHDLMRTVYQSQKEDFEQIFTPEQFRHHVDVFPEGQFVAFHGERLVGMTVSMRIDFDPEKPFIEPWWVTIGSGWLRHVPSGEWMYGVESNVDPEYQGRGVGGLLMEARFDTARLLNLRGMVAGSTLMSYAKHAHEVTPEAYVQGVVAGRYFDNNLSKQIVKGFRPVRGAVIPNYVHDPTALGWGCVIMWDNPDFDPSVGPRATLPEADRKRTYRAPLKHVKPQSRSSSS